tara:strand:+ start:2855 stop:4390 length:1536 start_codon:yes stop_codon:yes gene_type:complete
MGGYKVLITTSGVGSRLGKLTNYTNKCLVRVGDIPAISHIIEGYPPNTKFVITLGHFGDYVRQFLELAYDDKNFTFIDVDNYEGDGSSLGHSILQAKSELQCPFIFHASDTIIGKGDTLPMMDVNWCAGAYKDETSQYRTLKITGDTVDAINEKGEINFDYPYIGVCGIVDYELFWESLEGLENTHSLSDVHVINQMLNTVKFKFHALKTWLDIGNTNELEKARNYIGQTIDVLDKENESIFFFNDYVIKFFSDTTINQNRVKRAELLSNLTPKMIGSTSNFYKYEKANGSLFAKSVNINSFSEFLKWADTSLWVESKLEHTIFKELCYNFYITKTLKRVSQYLDGKDDTVQIINGIEVPPIFDIIDSLDAEWLASGIPSQFHGDFILDNVIETTTGYTLIDWRQDFAGDLEIGDLYYDLAKLNHNLVVNHEIVSNGHFNSDINDCHILCKSTLVQCTSILHDFITNKGYDLKKVKTLTGLIWINMAPLHEYPFNKFLFNYGKLTLWQTRR